MIIALCGAAGAGKSEVAKHLANNYDFIRPHPLQPMKDMLEAFGLTGDEINGSLKEAPCDKLGGKSPRHAQITLGTEWGRSCIAKDLWIRRWMQQYDGYDAVCESIRFPDEEKCVHGKAGVVIKIVSNRSIAPPVQWGLLGRFFVALGFKFPIHPSERHDLIREDYTIINNGSLADLHYDVDLVMWRIYGYGTGKPVRKVS